MDNKVFREKSLERISSTDELHDYMRVTSPRLWMFLSVILALIIGFIVFACLVTIENNVETKAQVYRYMDEGKDTMEIDVEIPDTIGDTVHTGMTVWIEQEEGTIRAIYDSDVSGKTAWVELKDPSLFLKEGTYDAKIVMETISPIQFLIR